MQTAFKLGYSLVVALLFVLLVILGTRTFYEEPEGPQSTFPFGGPGSFQKSIVPGEPAIEPFYCDTYSDEFRCFKGSRALTAEDEAKLSVEERQYVQEQRELHQDRQSYEQERSDYHRNVFILAAALGVAAIAAGLYLFRRVEAIPLGLVLGGLGVIIFGSTQLVDAGDIGEAPLFAAVAMGLAVVLATGYWFLGTRQPASQE